MKYILIALVILFFGSFDIFDPVKNIYQKAVSPVQFGLSKGAKRLVDTSEFYKNIKIVHDQNLYLETRVLKLESELVELEKLKQENIAIKSQLENKQTLNITDKVLLAYTMGNNQDLTGSTIYVNKGSFDGVKKGNNIIIDNIVVGVVKETSSSKSLVELITSSNLSTTVYDLSSSQKTEGLAVGQLGTSIIVERILPSEQINIGDIIVTSGKDGIFLPGLYLGKVSEVIEDPSQPLKKAYIKTLVDYSKLDKVFIVIEEENE